MSMELPSAWSGSKECTAWAASTRIAHARLLSVAAVAGEMAARRGRRDKARAAAPDDNKKSRRDALIHPPLSRSDLSSPLAQGPKTGDLSAGCCWYQQKSGRADPLP